MRTLAALPCLLLSACLFGGGGDDDGKHTEEQRPCFWVVLQLEQGTSNVPEYGSRRLIDNETQCWTLETSTVEATDSVEVTLTRVYEIDGDRRYGCELRGSGNSLRTELTEGWCLLPRPNDGHLRMRLLEPVDLQLGSIGDTLLTLEMSYEEREGEIVRHGEGVLSLASQVVLVGTIDWQEDLDPRGPTPDPFDACPDRPLCAMVDLEGAGVLRDDYASDPGCQDWLESRVSYGIVQLGVNATAEIDWEPASEGGVFTGIHELDECTVTAWTGTAPTADNTYQLTFDGPSPAFSMVLKDLWSYMGQTRYCEAEWDAPADLVDCP